MLVVGLVVAVTEDEFEVSFFHFRTPALLAHWYLTPASVRVDPILVHLVPTIEVWGLALLIGDDPTNMNATTIAIFSAELRRPTVFR